MRPHAQHGFTYLAVLFALALSSVALGGALTLWTIEEKRERETALLFVGDQYRQAIESYYDSTPGGDKQYPRDVRDLLDDRRAATPLHHLRRAYPDPVSGRPWTFVRTADGGLAGVRSPSAEAPLQQVNFDGPNEAFNGKRQYSDWAFTYSPHTTRNLPAVFLPPPQ